MMQTHPHALERMEGRSVPLHEVKASTHSLRHFSENLQKTE